MDEKQRMAIIQYLVEHLAQPGKVKLQKATYFLQEAMNVPLGYDFVMHYYGPYSFELDNTLEEMQGRDILKVTVRLYPTGKDYEFSPGKNEQGMEFPSGYKAKVERVTNFFKSLNAQKMELCATIHFVQSILKERGTYFNKSSVAKEVRELKPKFSVQIIEKWYGKLLDEKLLEPAVDPLIQKE